MTSAGLVSLLAYTHTPEMDPCQGWLNPKVFSQPIEVLAVLCDVG